LVKPMEGRIEKINPSVSLVSPDWVEKISEVVSLSLAGKRVVLTEDVNKSKFLPRHRVNPIVGIVQIGKGCLGNCTYCSEPYRGKLFSYPEEEIVAAVERVVRDGCREIWLTSLDTGCYGFDRGTNLARLLTSVCEVSGDFFVRVGMANPAHVKKILKELLEAYKNEKVFKFLHLPVQSGSERILELMGRNYKPSEVEGVVRDLRRFFPNISFSTDVIVGFPTETSKDFNETMKFVCSIKPDAVNISKFGAHPFTQAKKMKQVARADINKRSSRLAAVVKKLLLENNKKWVGWSGEVLVDEVGRKPGTWVGRNFAYKPVVVYSQENLLGRAVEAKVVGAKSTHLLAELRD